MHNKFIYLDHAATSPINPVVFEKMEQFLTSHYGNPSSIYSIGRTSKVAIESAREKVATAIGAAPNEIFFTSGGTESNNWAIKSIACANCSNGRHIITSSIEHHAVLHTCQHLEKNGFKVTYLPVDKYGIISAHDLESAIQDDTILISIMLANNEIGTIQPVEEMAKIAKQHNIYFHTDAVQAIGSIPLNLQNSDIDMLSLSAHKFYGPKGIGALYVRKGVNIVPYIHGGAQERNKRAGTENVAGIVGLGAAIELACNNIDKNSAHLKKLRDATISGILERIPHVRLNGHKTKRLPNNVNFSFEFVEGESMLLMLDMERIAASSGSACTSGSLDPSHVLLAIGLSHEIAHGSLRLTFGLENTESDVTRLLSVLPPIVQRLREMSPLYNEGK